VATEVLVGRKDRMWHSTGSGRVLILSFSTSFSRFGEFNFGAIAVSLSSISVSSFFF
jgi:hypothetical protein